MAGVECAAVTARYRSDIGDYGSRIALASARLSGTTSVGISLNFKQHGSALPQHDARGLMREPSENRGRRLRPSKRGRRECRMPEAPAASRAKMKQAHDRLHHRFAGTTRHSLHNGFNGFLRALPGDRLIATLASRKILAKLDAGIGASGPHGFAVHDQLRSSFEAARVHRFPRPTSVTIAIRPSSRVRDGAEL